MSRCPFPSAEAVGHELDLARFHRDPWPPFMATARIDAVWAHDGVLDARDYKTGRSWYANLAEDPRARIQAWVLARTATSLGLRLRLRYEFLSAEVEDDPTPWEPGPEELADVEEGLRTVVDAIRAEDDWRGAADDATCRICRYRSICPDSTATGGPAWPAGGPDGSEGDAGNGAQLARSAARNSSVEPSGSRRAPN